MPRFLALLLLLALAACVPPQPATPTPADPQPTATAVRSPAPSPTSVRATPTPAPAPTSTPAPTTDGKGWQPLAAGVEVLRTDDGLYALRHDPAAVQYTAHFQTDPNQASSVGEWLSADPAAIAAINCGFYRDDGGVYHHIGLLMSAGKTLSKLRSGWGGVLVVRSDQATAVRKPKRLLGPAALGLQGWPMLVENQTIIPQLDGSDWSRRTAAGVDSRGRVVWVAAPLGMTLADFAQRLLRADLGLVDAVNLDGGVSTGLRWRARPGALSSGPDSLPIPCAVLLSPA